jgi:hypothetical protein
VDFGRASSREQRAGISAPVEATHAVTGYTWMAPDSRRLARAGRRGAGVRPHVIHVSLAATDVAVGSGTGDDKGPYAAFLGRMGPEKGLRNAILAARSARLRLKISVRLTEEHEHRYYRSEVAPLVNGPPVVTMRMGSTRRSSKPESPTPPATPFRISLTRC